MSSLLGRHKYRYSIFTRVTTLIFVGFLIRVFQIAKLFRTKIDDSIVPSSINEKYTYICRPKRRCEPIRRNDDRISYVHISKNAGSSWIQELKRIKNISADFVSGPESFATIGLYPTKHGDHEHSVQYQEHILRQHYTGTFKRFLTLRSPRHHVWSLFSQCYFSQWGILETFRTRFPRSHPEDVMLDFRQWLNHFASNTSIRQEHNAFHCYHPANYQSRALSVWAENPHNVVDGVFEPNRTMVNQTYWNMDWVSLTSFFHESKCVLYLRMSKAVDESNAMIQDYLEQTCHCYQHQESSKLGQDWMDVKDTHYVTRQRPAWKDVPPDFLQQIDVLTTVDRFLYKIALVQFVDELRWVESELHRRILCDPVLDQWEDELAYLGLSLRKLYMGQQYHL